MTAGPAPGESSPAIELRAVTRAYGATLAVDRVSLAIGAGEFFSLLGPSGSGKTTCLRLIAGFEQPDAGEILLAGEDVSVTPPYARSVNTVFQDYALFPHMSVLENVTYGPRVKHVPAAECVRRGAELLELVQLSGLGDRRPAQLSGGQKQRVALARALINEPRVLLLDEPLGALDLKLREQMQLELRTLQRRLGITFVYVTHDQGEALSMSDRIAVFNHGRIEQLAAPQALYSRPRTAFVARFVGGANVIEGALAQRLAGAPRPFAVRAEHIVVAAAATRAPERMGCDGVVVDTEYQGATRRWQVRTDAGEVLVAALPEEAGNAALRMPGSHVSLSWQREHAVALEDDA